MFTYSSLYITTVAVIEVSVAMLLLGVEPNLAPVVVGLVTFSVYTNDRIADVETDADTNPAQAAFVRRYGERLYVLAAVAYGVAVTLAVLGGPVALAITLLPGMFWVVYALDWFGGVAGTVRRLKDVVLLNTVVIALAWAVTVTFLPLAFASGPLPPATGLVFAYFFLRDFVHTEVPNVPDRHGDARIGVDTLPSLLGVTATRRALYAVNGLTATLVAAGAVGGLLARPDAIALAGALCYSLFATALVGRWSREGTLGTVTEAEYPLTLLALVSLPTLL